MSLLRILSKMKYRYFFSKIFFFLVCVIFWVLYKYGWVYVWVITVLVSTPPLTIWVSNSVVFIFALLLKQGPGHCFLLLHTGWIVFDRSTGNYHLYLRSYLYISELLQRRITFTNYNHSCGGTIFELMKILLIPEHEQATMH
jgi:hypothetical protein